MKQSKPLTISVIIPVLNEEAYIGTLLSYIQENSSAKHIKEIIVVDGGSTDATAAIASDYGARVITSSKGRAKQLNTGAKHAQGGVLYFLHVDTFPPKDFDQTILSAVNEGHKAGCFQMKFDSKSRFLRFFAWFTKVNHTLCRGGDQSLFITRAFFQATGGYNEAYQIFEDNELIIRIYKMTPFKILPRYVQTSARRYEKNGVVRLQYHFGVIHFKNCIGAGPEQLYAYYKRHVWS
ncbi:TIGR04283 family arsenosugar biosynthesis glycosyltransferase [Arenibacter sp. GZD96]|uniref:TIGR04283 family arsenosugar biosynthesis glycosyltransferase n=1 Tax=Aurantibrevibacter litoralis TaxID=3106030 RepID=UPI002AFF5435|nr:TIGR04283 family arsenosugar biosynthesis glycosyltransferase [Arenibacter sp. GZD-96]MEA1785583.1 TIGR04283 family arsenosugar biosynthesis glycosyltransferase [Arenibacter sp. GZD-96]